MAESTTTPPTAPAAAGNEYARRLETHTHVMHAVIDGLSPEDWSREVGEGNSAWWLLAHLVSSRRAIRRRLSPDTALPAEEWETLVARGSTTHATNGLPAPETLAEEFRAANGQIKAVIASAPPTFFTESIGGKMPDGASDIGGFLNFMLFHEAYHLGQLGYLRRVAGKPGFA